MRTKEDILHYIETIQEDLDNKEKRLQSFNPTEATSKISMDLIKIIYQYKGMILALYWTIEQTYYMGFKGR